VAQPAQAHAVCRLRRLSFIGNGMGWDMGMANLRYMFQFGSARWMGIVRTRGEPVIWHAIACPDRSTFVARRQWVSDFRPFSGLDTIVDEVRRRGLEKAKIGLVDAWSRVATRPWLGDVIALKKALQADISDCTWMVQEMRLVQSERKSACCAKRARSPRRRHNDRIRGRGSQRRGCSGDDEDSSGATARADNFPCPSGPLDTRKKVWNLFTARRSEFAHREAAAEGDLVISEFHRAALSLPYRITCAGHGLVS
jgi:hypothetical protein